jgi:putative oxidoreductase
MDSNRLLMRYASLPLRSNVGFGFIMHGYLKIERGMDVFAAALQGLGIPASHLMAWTTTVIELLGWCCGAAGLSRRTRRNTSYHRSAGRPIHVHLPFGFS